MFSWLSEFKASATTSLAKFNNATFKNAAMATCALVAAADGKCDANERSKVAQLIQKNELLQVFGGAECRDLFERYVDKAADEFARIDVVNAVGKLKGNDEQSETCLKVALIIANADGTFDEAEKKVVAELCGRLGIVASRFVGE